MTIPFVESGIEGPPPFIKALILFDKVTKVTKRIFFHTASRDRLSEFCACMVQHLFSCTLDSEYAELRCNDGGG